MCPEPQLLSIYVDEELPSPWKEKLESHLTECSECREKVENLRRLQELFKKETHQKRTIVEKGEMESFSVESELMEKAKEKIWKKLESRQRSRFSQQRSYNVWRRRLSIPVPAAAAAAVIIFLVTAMWFRTDSSSNNLHFASQPIELNERENFILISEEVMPGVVPASSDLNSVLQHLGVDRSEVIILQLPENRSFSSVGEPAIIRSADYSRR